MSDDMAYRLRTFQGTVVRFWRERAYGYLRLDASPREAHFHLRDCEGIGGDMIAKGTRLQFYLEQTSKGLNAIRCSKVSE
jgi:cold shock CspA family protein